MNSLVIESPFIGEVLAVHSFSTVFYNAITTIHHRYSTVFKNLNSYSVSRWGGQPFLRAVCEQTFLYVKYLKSTTPNTPSKSYRGIYA